MDFSREQFDIIIQAGQSNSQGCGLGPVAEPFAVDDRVWYLNDCLGIVPAKEQVGTEGPVANFSLAFARDYIAAGWLAPGRKLLILRAAVGGTGFLDGRWGPSDDLFLQMMKMIETAMALNPANKPVALLWHQGETDAECDATEQGHMANLIGLIAAVRAACSNPELPFVAGDFVADWKGKNAAICEPVILAIRAVCDEVGAAKFVETAELASNDQRIGNGDDIHFCREALYALGRKYFAAFVGIVG